VSDCRYEIMVALAGSDAADPIVKKVDERVGALTASLVRRTRKERRIPRRILVMRPQSALGEVALEIFIGCLQRVAHAPVVEVIDYGAAPPITTNLSGKTGP